MVPPELGSLLAPLAELAVQYSLAVQREDRVLIVASQESRVLTQALRGQVLAAGGRCAQVDPELPNRSFMPPQFVQHWEQLDGCIFVESPSVDLPVQNSPATLELLDQFLHTAASGKLRWVALLYPSEDHARRAGTDLSGWCRILRRASYLDQPDPVAAWKALAGQQQILLDRLSNGRRLRFATPQGTDLVVGIAARKWINGSGRLNLPDGEVFTAPHEQETEGVLVVPFAALDGAEFVTNLRLRFERGQIVAAQAQRGQRALDHLLNTDAGARVLGEVAFGCNYALEQLTFHTMLDEKLGGSFHVALGAAYPETGGFNRSAVHRDLVVDLRQGGRVWLDTELLSVNGLFLDPSFPQP
jgi:aminopeptidase